MGSMAFILIAATVLMGYYCSIEAGATPDNLQVINLGGKVMCQDCTKSYGEWVRGTQPIKGCKVSVTCMDDRNRVMYYGSDETDEQGKFNMAVNKYINGKVLQAKSCLVRLVSSPHPTCNIPTNFAGGHTGVNLPIRPAVVYRDLVQYELGTFFYTTPRCDKPKPDSPDSCHGNNNY
ncbi:Pollen Ole e 1 allergen/extensin [Corchorus olitorius]|uniref:Pollen Ole e 1 allergen/extensin n=1 Tax=Corchorus olitorius TaxID=93759 RepID=A0A1R3IN86_9ROSI|nr:Pollen Ole e 1 allergen/extensin [Corchorus olitorius]